MTGATMTRKPRARRRPQPPAGEAPAKPAGPPARGAARDARRPITLGDVLRAFRALGATSDDDRRAIARLLGYDLTTAAAGPSTAAPVIAAPVVAPPPVAKPAPTAPAATIEADAPATELIRLPDIETNPVALPAPIARPVAAPPAPPLVEPLLAPAWAPAILARLGARMAPRGAIDLERMLPRIARRAPVRALPRRLRLVTAPRIAVVLDVSGVMHWLADDQAELVARLRATLRAPIDVVTADGPPIVAEPGAAGTGDPDSDDGPDVGSAEFDAADSDGGARPRLRVEHGTRVLAVTDLGAGSIWLAPPPGRILAWRGFAQALHAQGASLIVLTPVPAAQRPPELGALRCVHWDRRTRPSQVHALARQLG